MLKFKFTTNYKRHIWWNETLSCYTVRQTTLLSSLQQVLEMSAFCLQTRSKMLTLIVIINDALVQTSSKRFFSSSVLYSCEWCTRCRVTPLSCNRRNYGRCYSVATDMEKWKRVLTIDCSRNRSVQCAQCASALAVLLKDEESVWRVAHHRQQLLWQEHVAVIAAVDLHPGSTKMRSVRPSFEMSTDTITID